MKLTSYLFTFGILLAALGARAYQRTVSLEWEAVPGASSYELEFTRTQAPPEEKPLVVQIPDPQWSGPLSPGIYEMRMRSRDKRKVPGDWSSAEQFKVGLDPVKLIYPAHQAELKSDSKDKQPIRFQWQPTGGAKEYQLELSSEDGNFQESVTVSGTEITLDLPVAEKFSWMVKARHTDEILSETAEMNSFHVLGGRLGTPVFLTEDPRDSLKWSPPQHAQTYEYTLLRRNPNSGQWETLEKVTDSKEPSMPFQREWIGGIYLVQVRALAELWEPSDLAQISFSIEDLNRRPASLDEFQLKDKLERKTGLYLIAQQQMTLLRYTSKDVDNSRTASFTTMAGHGRFGVGSFGEGRWGWLATAELGGLYVESRTYTSARLELSGVTRTSTESWESRHYFGATAHELPLLTSTSNESYSVDRLQSIGPHYGYEKDWFFTERFGMQAVFQSYVGFMKVRTPNGQDMVPSLSFQLGLLGSYQIAPKTRGFYGYTYRQDSATYQAKDPTSANSRIELAGHYLNFFLEWAL
jgi:hypothetical protein